MNPGTPVAQQRAERDHIGLPASTSSLVFLSESLANCVRLGLLMSGMRNVGCPPTVLGPERWGGSCLTGCGPPGTAVQSVPTATHPRLAPEKSGGLCASAVEAPAQTRPANRPKAREFRD